MLVSSSGSVVLNRSGQTMDTRPSALIRNDVARRSRGKSLFRRKVRELEDSDVQTVNSFICHRVNRRSRKCGQSLRTVTRSSVAAIGTLWQCIHGCDAVRNEITVSGSPSDLYSAKEAVKNPLKGEGVFLYIQHEQAV